MRNPNYNNNNNNKRKNPKDYLFRLFLFFLLFHSKAAIVSPTGPNLPKRNAATGRQIEPEKIKTQI
jgi:hypothetical protein